MIKAILKNFAKFQEKTKKRLQHRCFPVNIANFLRALILKNIGERLLLYGPKEVFAFCKKVAVTGSEYASPQNTTVSSLDVKKTSPGLNYSPRWFYKTNLFYL